MKRISILLALTLSLSLLSACGGNEPAASTGNPSSESSADSQQVLDESAEQTTGVGADFLSPEYDYTTNELKLTDLSTGEVTATYAFDAAQTPLLTGKTSQGGHRYAVQPDSGGCAGYRRGHGDLRRQLCGDTVLLAVRSES